MAKRIKGSNLSAVITDGKVTGLAVNGNDIGVVTATKNTQGLTTFDDAGKESVRSTITDTTPILSDDTIRITISGNAISLPCTLKRIRCVAGSAIALSVYDDINDNTGYQFPTFPQTLSAGQDAVIPDGGIVVMHGVYCKFTGTATFDITVGTEK